MSPSQDPHLPSAGPDSIEDTGSRALADALRSSFAIVKIVMVLLAILFVASGVFIVSPQERAVVFRLGKPIGTGEDQLRGPGIHFAFPYPIDEVVRIPVSEIQTVRSTIGWYPVNPDGSSPGWGATLNPDVDGYVVTGDGNIIHARATLRYRITDPLSYSFRFEQAPEVVTNLVNNALLHAAAQFPVDRALREDRAGFRERILQHVNRGIVEHQLGITVESGELDAIPPRQVKEAFDAVTAAVQEQSSTNNAALSYAASLLTRTAGETNSIVSQAMSERIEFLQTLEADAQYFGNRLADYRENPRLFTERLLVETWQRVLTNAQEKILLPESRDGARQELRLLLNRLPPERRSQQQSQQP